MKKGRCESIAFCYEIMSIDLMKIKLRLEIPSQKSDIPARPKSCDNIKS